MSAADVTRSTQATTARDAAAVAQRRGALPNGFWGMAAFVATETTLFGVLIGSYFYLRFRNGPWPPLHEARPAWLVPAILTAVLVATSLPIQLSYRAGQAGRRVRACWLLALVALVQAGYLAWSLHEFAHQLDVTPPRVSSYASIDAVLVGADHFHVFVGVLLGAWMVGRLASRLTTYRLNGLLATAFYLHAVNAITVLVLLTHLSPYA